MQIQLNGRIKLIRLKFKRNGVPWKIFLLHFPSFVKAILPLEIKLISEPITDPLLKDISRYDVVSRGMVWNAVSNVFAWAASAAYLPACYACNYVKLLDRAWRSKLSLNLVDYKGADRVIVIGVTERTDKRRYSHFIIHIYVILVFICERAM